VCVCLLMRSVYYFPALVHWSVRENDCRTLLGYEFPLLQLQFKHLASLLVLKLKCVCLLKRSVYYFAALIHWSVLENNYRTLLGYEFLLLQLQFKHLASLLIWKLKCVCVFTNAFGFLFSRTRTLVSAGK